MAEYIADDEFEGEEENAGGQNGCVGRPNLNIDRNALIGLLDLNLSVSEIARRLSVSRTTVYAYIKKLDIPYQKFTEISNDDLDNLVLDIKENHPTSGEVMMQGHVQSRNVNVPRKRLRQSIHRVDPIGVTERLSRPIRRRVYSVPCPNYVWHLDGNHKLIRWKMVIHVGIDGFSRKLVYQKCSNNNRSETVLREFESAVNDLGPPLRVRTDYGGENQMVWTRMMELRDVASRPVILGSSVHNQRVERYNRELNRLCTRIFRNIFYELENEQVLNPDNPTDIICLHRVFIPLINKTLNELMDGHNNHKVSTERNFTPDQLFYSNMHLLQIHANDECILPGNTQDDVNELPHVVFDTLDDAPFEQFIDFDRFIPTTIDEGAIKYKALVAELSHVLLNLDE